MNRFYIPVTNFFLITHTIIIISCTRILVYFDDRRKKLKCFGMLIICMMLIGYWIDF